jgi:hypothetical protein
LNGHAKSDFSRTRFRRLKGRSEGGEVQKTQPIFPSSNAVTVIATSRGAA